MKFELEPFQEKAASALVKAVRRAQEDYAEDAQLTAIGLTAPTGAGKTVIATALLERLLVGGEGVEPDPNLRVLWVTDDKNLNRQTITKINDASDRLTNLEVRFIDELDQRTFDPGVITFVHIQQLQKNSTIHAVRNGQRSDLRTHGAWDMIAQTVADHGADLLVIVDEAHRGSSSKSDRSTIVGTILNGGTTNIGTPHPAAPVVLGISATPERFLDSMGANRSSVKQVQVPPADVRESGLLKDRILIKHIAEEQVADHTMLMLAVEDLKASDAAWAAHHEATGDRRVEPLLVVQVEPAVTTKRLDEILATLESAWPALKGMAVAHAFGDPHGPLTVGDRAVRYLEPEAIERDEAARVVLFKSALTTGWDCPRAEVLISFQSRESYTEIAQLIGRLVRTPLAKRVDGDDLLNAVVGYLPGFNAEHVVKVVAALTSDQTVDVDMILESVDCHRVEGSGEAVALIESLPTWARPGSLAGSRIAQLMRLASALAEHELRPGASKVARAWVLGQLVTRVETRSDEVEEMCENLRTVDVGVTTVALGATVEAGGSTTTVAASMHDLESYFLRAQRTLPDGVASSYFNRLRDDGLDDANAKVRVAAVASLGFSDVVEEAAVALITEWRRAHQGDVAALPSAVRSTIEPLWTLTADDMISASIELPLIRREATQRVEGDGLVPIDLFDHHLFVARSGPASGRFPVVTTSWERGVLDKELGRPGLVTWYRNPPSGRQALAIPYTYGGSTNLLHPDFLFVHDDEGRLVVDIVDPHRHDDGATAEKWASLARYAQATDQVRRAVAVISVGANLRGLNLTAQGIDERLAAAGDGGHIEALFLAEGFDY